MIPLAFSSGTGRSDGEDHIAKIRKENLKALREREHHELKANEKTRKLREMRLAREQAGTDAGKT